MRRYLGVGLIMVGALLTSLALLAWEPLGRFTQPLERVAVVTIIALLWVSGTLAIAGGLMWWVAQREEVGGE